MTFTPDKQTSFTGDSILKPVGGFRPPQPKVEEKRERPTPTPVAAFYQNPLGDTFGLYYKPFGGKSLTITDCKNITYTDTDTGTLLNGDRCTMKNTNDPVNIEISISRKTLKDKLG